MIDQDIANTIVDGKAFAAGAPVDAAFAAIRALPGIATAEPAEYDRFWVVGRHADVLDVERRSSIFLNNPRPSVVSNKLSQTLTQQITGGEANLIRSLVAVDGAEHKSLRGIVFPALTPQNVRKLEDDVRRIAREFVADMLTRAPECDFAKDVAFLYPLRVIMTVLGVPQEDEPLMLKLTQEIFSSADPEFNRDHKEVTPAEIMGLLHQTMLDLEAYFGAVTQKFRANPAENVNSLIANARIDGEYLTHRQIMGYYIIAATAGHDTTSNTTASALWALAENPQVFAQLQADRALLPTFVEESIRWATPVKHFMRTAAEDTEIAGQKISRDDWLMLSYHSANQDESVFAAPHEFRLDRAPNKQVAFGYGAHVCLGQHLARMEMRILWEELLPHIKSLELAGEPQRTRSNFVCGPKSVPVRFTLN